MRFSFIEAHRGTFSVHRMCSALGVSPSGYYAWRSRPESARSREDRRLAAHIRGSFVGSRQSYGSRRIQDDLKAVGMRCGRDRIRRLMGSQRLVAKKTRQFRPQTTRVTAGRPVAENLVEQQFQAEAPDRIWAGDVTCIRTGEGWLYLAVLLDLHSRRVVGWSTGADPDTDLCLRALRYAVRQRRPAPGLIHHSDRGSQYTAQDYRNCLDELGFRASMSGVGNCYDNAVVESFFDSLKTEGLEGAYRTRQAAHEALLRYIEGFYNRRRRHSTLGGLSPDAFERLTA